MMETRVLGKSELQITRIGLGAWAMGGGGWTWSWGPQDDQKSIDAIYALGHSEEVVGRALKGRSSRPYIFTKCERVWDERGNIGGSLKAESIRRECEASLRRL